MNELLLIDMLSELNPELLQDDYMERDLKDGVFSFLKKLFSFKRTTEQSVETLMQEEVSEAARLIGSDYSYEEESLEAVNEEQKEYAGKTSGLGFSIHIFQKKINIFVKIISGITATLVLVIGIFIFFITKNKGSFLLKRNKAALN
jgi:ABC-type bacteriocin/lantibiotic exporter with double-glycine peptidase domain